MKKKQLKALKKELARLTQRVDELGLAGEQVCPCRRYIPNSPWSPIKIGDIPPPNISPNSPYTVTFNTRTWTRKELRDFGFEVDDDD